MLLNPIGPDMAWPRHLRRPAEPAQILDAALGRHQAAELAAHPLGNLAPGPPAPVGRWFSERDTQPLLLGLVQQRGRAWIVVAAVTQPCDAVVVVAPHDLAGRRVTDATARAAWPWLSSQMI